MVLVYPDTPGARRTVDVDGAGAVKTMLLLSDWLSELGIALAVGEGGTVLEIALVWLDTASEDKAVLDVVAEADEAGAATITVPGEPLVPAIVLVYGATPGGNAENVVTKR